MNVKEAFQLINPLVIHWDVKILPDIITGSKKVARLPILVSSNDCEKLLGIQ